MLTTSRRAAAALALSTALAAAPALAAEDGYDIHVIVPLTGGGAFLGMAEHDAMKIAAPVINQEDGMQRPLRVQ